MQYFQNCPQCELSVLAVALMAIWFAILLASYKPKRRWGCNPHDAKYGRK